MSYANDVIQVATAELGYHAKETNDQLDDKKANFGAKNFTKYARDMDFIYSSFYDTKRNGVSDWSGLFFDYCMVKAYGEQEALRLMYLEAGNRSYDLDYKVKVYIDRGKFDLTPKIGDQVFFENNQGHIDHTGLVVKVNAESIIVIEGDCGEAVIRMHYKFAKSPIKGYGHPDYSVPPVTSILFRFAPKSPLWDFGDDPENPIRHNMLDISALGSISNETETSSEGERTTSVKYDTGNGPVLIAICENGLTDEQVANIESLCNNVVHDMSSALKDPIDWDKALRPSLYVKQSPGGGGGEDGGGGNKVEEVTTLQTPLNTLLTEIIRGACSEAVFTGSKTDGVNQEKNINFVEWIGISAYGCRIVFVMPSFTYTVNLMKDDDKTWDVILFNKPAVGSIIGATRLYEKYQNLQCDLVCFEGATGLQTLHLYNCNLVGNLSSLSGCSALSSLNIGYTNIEGELSSLANTSMTNLRLYNTSISCNVKQLDSMQNLEAFNINNTGVHGDLQDISSLEKLKIFDISDTHIQGDISAIADLTDLEEIWLNQEGIYGDIKHLSKLTNLKKIHLSKMNIYGDIVALSDLSHLTHLELESLNVTGDISQLHNLAFLRVLRICSTPIGGMLPDLNPSLPPISQDEGQDTSGMIGVLPKIQMAQLHLEKTNIYGDIKDIPSQLTELTLVDSNFYGDIAGLQKLTKLDNLYLSNVHLTGDIQVFSGKSNLIKLDIHNVQLTGDISCLSGLQKLEYLALAQTQVSGDIGQLYDLPVIDLFWVYSSNVTGDIRALAQFNTLHKIRINDTDIYGYYSALKDMKNLTSLNVFGTRITGDPHSLDDLHLAVFCYGDQNSKQIFPEVKNNAYN